MKAIQCLISTLLYLIPPFLLLFGSAFLSRRVRDLPFVLMTAGAAAFLVFGLYMALGAWGIIPAMSNSASIWVQWVGIGSTVVGGVCFSIGYFWFALRQRRT